MTFDLNYAALGWVPLAPTREPSTRLLLIYEGTNLCLNKPAGNDKDVVTLCHSRCCHFGAIRKAVGAEPPLLLGRLRGGCGCKLRLAARSRPALPLCRRNT